MIINVSFIALITESTGTHEVSVIGTLKANSDYIVNDKLMIIDNIVIDKNTHQIINPFKYKDGFEFNVFNEDLTTDVVDGNLLSEPPYPQIFNYEILQLKM